MKRTKTKRQRLAAAEPRTAAGPVVEHLLREGAMIAPDSALPTVKRLMDIALSLAIALVAAPIALVAAALVRMTSRGPVIYTQERVGRREQRFTIYKIRTMIHECESLSGPKWSVPGDPRVTAVGRVLRRLHIDELPQLINVLRGEMSLVGPRPERPVFVNKLSRKIPHYPARHAVLPGITGLAQIFLPPDIDEDDVQRKLTFDLYYARHADLWIDFKILFCTGLKVLCVPRSVIRALLPLRAESLGLQTTLAFPQRDRRSQAA